MKKFSNKKKIILGSIIGVLIGTLMSVSYAFFTYANTGGNNILLAGDIYLKYGETLNSINLSGAMPSSTYPTKAAGNYFQFQITGKNTHPTGNVLYKLKLAYGNEEESPKQRIDDKYLLFKLVEVENLGEANEEEKVLVMDANYETIPNSVLYANTIPKNTTNEIIKTYRLYARISNDVVIGSGAGAIPASTWNNLYASIKLNAEGSYTTGDIASNKILSRYDVTTVTTNPQDGLVAVKTDGTLSTNANDEIREYRYVGGGRYCTYSDGTDTYNLQVEGDTCDETTLYTGYFDTPSLYRTTNDIKYYANGGNVGSGTTYTRTTELVQDTGLRNYITFNNEKWRIVGIFNGELKIMKDLPLRTDDTNIPSTYTNLAGTTFDIKSSQVSGQPTATKYAPVYFNNGGSRSGKNDWANAGLMYYSNEDNTGSYYKSIDSNFRNMIATTTYYLSNVTYNSGIGTASTVYNEERATPVECASTVISNSHNNSCNIWYGNSATWTGKIALLYPSDFGYASSPSKWSTNISGYYNANTNHTVSDNWIIHTDAYSNWFLSPSSFFNFNHVMTWRDAVAPIGYRNGDSAGYAWRPVLNLKSDTIIVSGDGSYDTPYVLGAA